MKLVVMVVALIASQAAAAQEAKPTEDSVRQLFQAMHSASIVATLMTQIEGNVRASMQQAVAEQKPNPQQQKILDDMQRKIVALVQEQLNWADLEPLMVEVYRRTFSQHEVDGMLSFYRSEVGQAVVAKLPTATQQSMTSIQNRMKTLTPKILQLEHDTAAQLKAAADAPPAPATPATPH